MYRREKSPDEEPFVSYRFFKNPNEIWTPGQPGSHTAQKPKLSGLPSASESTLEAIGDIVHDSFHSDPVRDRAGMYGMYGAPKGRDSLHQEFMDQLWVLLNSQGQKGYSDDVKVNGFTPDTWQRISKLQEYREKIRETEKQLKRDRPMGVRKADAESSTVPLPAITVASVTKPKPAHRHKKSEAQISRDTQSHDKSDHILPLGVNRLNRKFQASYKTVLDLLSKHPFETGVERTEEQKQLLHSCLRNHGALKKLSDAAFEQICGCLRLESIPANKIIFSQGDPGNCWYIILLGHVRIKANKPIKETGGIAEEPKTVATLGPGEGFGDHGLQNESVRGASAISASEPVYLVRVDKSDYKKIMRLRMFFSLLGSQWLKWTISVHSQGMWRSRKDILSQACPAPQIL